MILQQGLFFVGGGRAGIFGLRVEQGGLVNPTRHWSEKNSLGLDLPLRLLQPNLIEGHLKCLLPLFLVRTGNDGRCHIKK